MPKTLSVGDKAPDFSMPVSDSSSVSLATLAGKKVVLYFYPKDDTPGCTLEAKDFRDHMKEFEKAGAVIIGVSKDSIKSHEKFREKFCLPFPLASDESGAVCEAYGTWVEKSMYGKTYMGIQRDTFLIDGKGKLGGIWRKVKVDGHVAEVLAAVKAL
ncbi:MAG: thioredoxin-dependent thiol peroxidase [Alphaproteobacteria bacterium]|nr:thioredoxin-dependent thiol peroxidase [Alphaproteobacteria bacterium]